MNLLKHFVHIQSIIILLLGLIVQSNAYAVNASQKKAINADLDKAARQIAHLLGTPAFRKFLSDEKQTSRNREQILVLEDTLTKAKGRKDLGLPPGILKKILGILSGIKVKMKDAGYQAKDISFDLYFPVEVHRKKWEGQPELLVAFGPADDEKEVTSITAYMAKTGEKTVLDPAKAPDTPTLVIALEEHLDHKLVPPLPISPEDENEEASLDGIDAQKIALHEGNSYIGIPRILITTDLEPWWRGDPEVFVLVGQSYKTSPKSSTIYLPGVNDTDKWYNLGSSTSSVLYFYFTSEDYSNLTYFDFWERDGGGTYKVTASVAYKDASGAEAKVGLEWSIKDGDDHFGSRYINKEQLSYVGWLTQSTGYVKFKVDKDP